MSGADGDPSGVATTNPANTQTAPSHNIPLSGSADLITEFFTYGLNTILYQRGLYPPESFRRISKYGLTMLVTTDPPVRAYLDAVLSQMREWLHSSQLRRVAVVVASVHRRIVLERWVFDVHLEHAPSQAEREAGRAPSLGSVPAGAKDDSRIVAEIQALVRQITASVAFLPLLDESCSFDVLIYTTEDTETPVQWETSTPRLISNADNVELRSFSTSVHRIGASVSYARDQSL